MVLFSNFCVYCYIGNAIGGGIFYLMVVLVAKVMSTNGR
jgi:formate/nitrite transporter FocA (FNT family)